jgi:hypothetical protein
VALRGSAAQPQPRDQQADRQQPEQQLALLALLPSPLLAAGGSGGSAAASALARSTAGTAHCPPGETSVLADLAASAPGAGWVGHGDALTRRQ